MEKATLSTPDFSTSRGLEPRNKKWDKKLRVPYSWGSKIIDMLKHCLAKK